MRVRHKLIPGLFGTIARRPCDGRTVMIQWTPLNAAPYETWEDVRSLVFRVPAGRRYVAPASPMSVGYHQAVLDYQAGYYK